VNAPSTALRAQDTTGSAVLHMSMELGERTWWLTFGDGRHGPSRHHTGAGDVGAVLLAIAKVKQRWALPVTASVCSCYEAGRDGWWLHRSLLQHGIDNVVVDSASIERNRRARQAKTDRIDGDKLLGLLMRHHGGERGMWSVVRAPTEEQEDQRWLHREMLRLQHERTTHTNRIGSLLALQGLRVASIGTPAWNAWWAEHASALRAGVRQQIERECQRLALVQQQLRELRSQRRAQVRQGVHPQVNQLMKLRAIGETSAWLLCMELFAWRAFANRRQLAACIGLAPTPYDSGTLRAEQGITKAGNKRCRALLVELAWLWLRLQPHSALTQWFRHRFGSGKRTRRIGIVALARRLVVALWRYLEHGVIPEGATLKPVSV